jgi:hypothetical protein
MANKIQIKRSTTTAAPTGLANGELAYTSNGEILFLGHPDGTTGSIPIGGRRVPGTLTANQALVANSTSAIDKVIVANLVPTFVYANGGVGSAGQILTSGAAGNVYWSSPSAGVAGSNSQVQFNANGVLSGDAGFVFDGVADALILGGAAQTTSPTFRVANSTTSANLSSASLTIGTAVVNASAVAAGTNAYMNTTAVFISTNSTINSTHTAALLQVSNSTSTSNLTATQLSIGANVFANTTAFDVGNTIITSTNLTLGGQVTANAGVGTAGQVLTSGAAGNVYWTTPTTGTVTSVTGGNGLTGSVSTTGALDVGEGAGLSVTTDAVAVKANNGIIANTTGTFVDGANGVSVDASGVNVLRGDGTLTVNATGVYVNTANLSVATSQLSGDVALGTQTSGNYVATITAGAGISGTGTGEGSTPTIAVVANSGLVSNSTGVFVLANTGIIANSTGVFVNPVLSLTDLTLSGNLDINGTLTTVDTTNLSVTDSLISLARGQTTANTLDIGIYGTYGNATVTSYSGLFRDATDSKYKLFAGAIPEPTTTVDTANVNYAGATLVVQALEGANGTTSFIDNFILDGGTF